MKNILFIISLAILFASCRKKATIDLPKAENKLVVTCFIQPGDSLVTAVVRSSSPKFKGGNIFNQFYEDIIANATVKLNDGTNTLELIYDADSESYIASTLNFPINSGSTYYLTASTPDGKNVSANTTVPNGKLEYETLEVRLQKNDSLNLEYASNIVVNDLPDVTNYVNINYQNVTSTVSSNPEDATETSFDYVARFFDTDEKVQKTKYSHNTTNAIFAQANVRYAGVYVSILNCSKEFYLYSKSAEQAFFSNGNPFADPVLIYSNITNGFGCFGSFVSNNVLKKIR